MPDSSTDRFDIFPCKKMLFFIIITTLIPLTLSYQKEVDILYPCNDNQQYTLGKGDVLYMKAESHTLDPNCQASIQAAQGCSKLCFTMEKLEFKDCVINFKASSGLTNAKIDYMADCKTGSVGDIWCSEGTAAMVQISSSKGFDIDERYTYSVLVKVTADCEAVNVEYLQHNNISVILGEHEEEHKDRAEWTMSQGAFIGAIIGACIASIVGTSLLFLLIYFVCVKRKHESENMIQYQNPRYAPVPDGGLVIGTS